MLGFTLIGELIVDRFPLVGGNLENFAFVLEQRHGNGGLRAAGAVCADYGGSGGVRHSQLVFQEMLAGEKFGIAAEQNVRAATGHVGGYGDRAFAAGLRDDAGFTLVLLGVEHLVRSEEHTSELQSHSDLVCRLLLE